MNRTQLVLFRMLYQLLGSNVEWDILINNSTSVNPFCVLRSIECEWMQPEESKLVLVLQFPVLQNETSS